MKHKNQVLCTANSAWSQMAEAIVNGRLGDEWQAFSAGTEPAGYVHPRALCALAEVGIMHQGHSKQIVEFRDVLFDRIVTVCGDVAENCPVWLGQGRQAHVGIPDPAEAAGTEEEAMPVFRAVRDEMAHNEPALLRQSTAKDPNKEVDSDVQKHRCPIGR
jgi:arsenate reductase